MNQLKKQHKKVGFKGGVQVIVPPNMTEQQVLNLYKKWDKKLAKTGFQDLERYTKRRGVVGLVNKVGNTIGRSANFHLHGVNAGRAEYYRILGLFVNQNNFDELFGKSAKAYKWVADLLLEGLSQQEIRQITKWKVSQRQVPIVIGEINALASEYWDTTYASTLEDC